MTQTGPDRSVAVAFLSQLTEKSFAPKHIKSVSEVISFPMRTKVFDFLPLLQQQLHIKASVDSSIANNKYLHSQLGYSILLCDGIEAHITEYVIQKNQRTARSVICEELYAFADAFDCSNSFKHGTEKPQSYVFFYEC